MTIHRGIGLCLFIIWLAGCGEQQTVSITPAINDKFADTSQLAKPPGDEIATLIPELTAYRQRVTAALNSHPPILQMNRQELDSDAGQRAQQLAVSHPEFLRHTRDPKTGAVLRNEIMTVRKALPATAC